MLLDSCDPESFLHPAEKLGEAVRNVVQSPALAKSTEDAPGFLAEGRGGQAGERLKTGAEGAQALVADFKADIGDAVVAGEEQFLGLVDSQARDELVWSLVERLSEQPVEMDRRKLCVAGDVLK